MAIQTKLVIIFLLSSLLYGREVSADSDVGLNTVEMIEKHGYVCETHYITTEDGYILTYHRIPHGKNNDNSTKRPAVLLMHGLISSSADYVNMGPNNSLAYILADIGYDVWLGNARGNGWSRNHTTLDIVADAEKFFDFSWHEIGYYDLPAAIDYILDVNGDDSIYYVGHSQGTTAFMVLGSTRPEYNSKIKIASLMGPASYMEHQSTTLLVGLSKYIFELEKVVKKYTIFEIPLLAQLRKFASDFCSNPDSLNICEDVIGLIGGQDKPQFDFEKFPVILTNAPSNAAMKQLYHYGQLIKNGGFSQFDFGSKEKNKEIYGTDTPPAYDLSKISAPVAVYYGKNDQLVNYLDAQTVVKNLGNVANDYFIPYDLFDHLDFIFAKDVVNMLYVELIKVMQKY
ncbi:lipase 1 [Tribolium castaneum]|uniref:Lipase n=1 Tax=Tribolium castaneum TaxID=7070 RepID=D2A0W9_TRICA|nr:PREDICTED: lipase 1 [Tribolium castaneum]EFA01620.1 Lipase 1-like Protein [Tribolium castaneum]|eukprot:XP_972874.1 PREDICTED: lipase 1 [Tribolium castaneum]